MGGTRELCPVAQLVLANKSDWLLAACLSVDEDTLYPATPVDYAADLHILRVFEFSVLNPT